MLLTIDVGNTNTVLGVFDGDQIVEHWRINTDPDRTADEMAVLLRGLLEHSSLVKDADVSGIALCSTVPSVLHEMREMCRRYYGDIPSLIIEPGVRTGVSVRMDNPKEVGSDRIMNTVAAVHLYGGPAIVVDFGTSTNFDAASEKGEFVGGALAPGIEISVDALTRRAAQLLKVELTRPHHVIGKNTVEALQSGIIFGFAGQVEGIARRGAGPAGYRRGERHRRVRAVADADRAAPGVRAQQPQRVAGGVPGCSGPGSAARPGSAGPRSAARPGSGPERVTECSGVGAVPGRSR
jgi:type III pantothenate kinase